jgi:hypothetical protein
LPTGKKKSESEQIMNLLSSEEATNFKARSIALASVLKIELADEENRPPACCANTIVKAKTTKAT